MFEDLAYGVHHNNATERQMKSISENYQLLSQRITLNFDICRIFVLFLKS